MKMASGYIRSKEIGSKAPMKLDHMEVHPMDHGGVTVMHVHTEPGVHPAKLHEFSASEGGKFVDHMMEHSGMSWEGEGEGAKEPNAGAENEVQGLDGDKA
jgi:hypothetical protein